MKEYIIDYSELRKGCKIARALQLNNQEDAAASVDTYRQHDNVSRLSVGDDPNFDLFMLSAPDKIVTLIHPRGYRFAVLSVLSENYNSSVEGVDAFCRVTGTEYALELTETELKILKDIERCDREAANDVMNEAKSGLN